MSYKQKKSVGFIIVLRININSNNTRKLRAQTTAVIQSDYFPFLFR